MSETATRPELPPDLRHFGKMVIVYNATSELSVAAYNDAMHRLDLAKSDINNIPISTVETSKHADDTYDEVTEHIDPLQWTILAATMGDGSWRQLISKLPYSHFKRLALLPYSGGTAKNLHKSAFEKDREFIDYMITHGHAELFSPMSFAFVDANGNIIMDVGATSASFGNVHHGMARINSEKHRSGKLSGLRNVDFLGEIGRKAIRGAYDGAALATGLLWDAKGKKWRALFPEGEFEGQNIMYINAPETATIIKAPQVKLGGGFIRATNETDVEAAKALIDLRRGKYNSPETTIDSFVALSKIPYQIEGNEKDEHGEPYFVEPGTTVIITQAPPIYVVTNRPDQFPVTTPSLVQKDV